MSQNESKSKVVIQIEGKKFECDEAAAAVLNKIFGFSLDEYDAEAELDRMFIDKETRESNSDDRD